MFKNKLISLVLLGDNKEINVEKNIDLIIMNIFFNNG